MFIAHFGIGFGAKKFAPAVSLGALFIASQFLDLLWPLLLQLGLEHVRIAPGITRVTPLVGNLSRTFNSNLSEETEICVGHLFLCSKSLVPGSFCSQTRSASLPRGISCCWIRLMEFPFMDHCTRSFLLARWAMVLHQNNFFKKQIRPLWPHRVGAVFTFDSDS